MPTSLINPVFHADDAAGRPLVGGKLRTYQAGTSTPAVTYRDSTGTPNPNPIILDGRGEAMVYLDGRIQYKLVLEDAKGILVWSADNVVSADFYANLLLPQAVDAAVAAVQPYVVLAQQAQLGAEQARDAARAARDGAIAGANLYPDEPTGRAAVADGQTFNVQGAGGVAAYQYRRTNSTTSVLLAVYPSTTGMGTLDTLGVACKWIDASVYMLDTAQDAYNWWHPAYRRVEGALAIQDAWIENGVAGETYTISVLCYQHPTYKDRIQINRSDGTTVLTNGNVDVVKNPSGVTRVVLGTTQNDASIRAILDIDYRKISLPGILESADKGLFRIAKKPKPATLPNWVRNDARQAITHDRWFAVAYAIKGIWLEGMDSGRAYRVTVLTKNHATFGARLFVDDDFGNGAHYIAASPDPTGIQTVALTPSGANGFTGFATIDWDAIIGPFVVSNSASGLLIDVTRPDMQYSAQFLREYAAQIRAGGGAGSSAKVFPPFPMRVALAGSSITWGSGYLGEQSFVGGVERALRTQHATTLHASEVAPSALQINGPNFYGGQIRRLSGVNASAEFDLYGDELTVNLVRQRGGDGAALVDVYSDGTLFGTISTYNAEPSGNAVENFSGSGAAVKFDLARAFTYGHVVTVGGTALVGGMNTQGSGASIPAGWDYMIVRRWSVALGRVVHTVWFRTAPTAAIVVAYNYGESISYMRGTLGNTGVGVDTPLESAFGDGVVSEDTTQPADVSSGLGFRDSDPRACETLMFGDAKTRRIKLVVRAMDPRGSGTPRLDLNFVTNRMHHIMNAGIGGWTADLLLTSDVAANRIERVAEWRPDMLLLESCTNDDWQTHVSHASRTRTGLTAADVKADDSSNYYNAMSGNSPNITVQDDRIPIVAASATSITLDTTGATITAQPGDALIIGSYRNDHRRVAVRLVDTYAAGIVTFKRPISAGDFAQVESLAGLVGDWAMVKAAPAWLSQVEQCVNLVQGPNPDCEISIATAGQPNYHHRRLLGYRELGQALARAKGWEFVDFYAATGRFQYRQPQTGRVYIGAGSSTASTGAASYTLVTSANAAPTARMLHMPRIVVNGVDRTNKGCYIEGGYAYSWAAGVANPSLANDTLFVRPYRLVFTSDVPPAGAVIEVYYGQRVWSTDDTHPGQLSLGVYGVDVFGNAAAEML